MTRFAIIALAIALALVAWRQERLAAQARLEAQMQDDRIDHAFELLRELRERRSGQLPIF